MVVVALGVTLLSATVLPVGCAAQHAVPGAAGAAGMVLVC